MFTHQLSSERWNNMKLVLSDNHGISDILGSSLHGDSVQLGLGLWRGKAEHGSRGNSSCGFCSCVCQSIAAHGATQENKTGLCYSLLSRSRLSPVQFFQLRLDWTATKILYRAVHCSVPFSFWFMIIDSWTLYLHHWQLWFVFNLNWRLKQFFDLGWNWSDLLFLEETLQTQKKCQVSNRFHIEILNKLLATIFGDMLHSLWTYVDHHYSG